LLLTRTVVQLHMRNILERNFVWTTRTDLCTCSLVLSTWWWLIYNTAETYSGFKCKRDIKVVSSRSQCAKTACFVLEYKLEDAEVAAYPRALKNNSTSVTALVYFPRSYFQRNEAAPHFPRPVCDCLYETLRHKSKMEGSNTSANVTHVCAV
jgi:hypothetical protein